MLDDQVLRNTLKRMLPEMDAATVTLNALKEALHQELGVSHEELKQSKKLIKEIVAELLYLCKNSSSTPVKATPEPVKKAIQKKNTQEKKDTIVKRKLSMKKSNRVIESEDDEEDENNKPGNEQSEASDASESEEEAPKPKKQRRDSSSSSESPSPKKKKSVPVKKPTQNWSSEGYDQLKLLARTAGVLAPAIYKKLRDADSQEEAEAILKERLAQANVKWHGKYPSRHDISALKKKKALAQELDGIDPSLIIDHGPRRPSRRVVGVYDLGPKPKFNDENEESDDESDSGSEASFQLHDDDDEEEVENE